MPCPDRIDQICMELGENIDSEVCRELRKHLEACPDCKTYVDSLRKTVHLYRDLPGVLPTQKATKALFKKLDLE